MNYVAMVFYWLFVLFLCITFQAAREAFYYNRHLEFSASIVLIPFVLTLILHTLDQLYEEEGK